MKELEEAGWTLDRVAGSHHIFTHRYNPNTIAVPHPEEGTAGDSQKHPAACRVVQPSNPS